MRLCGSGSQYDLDCAALIKNAAPDAANAKNLRGNYKDPGKTGSSPDNYHNRLHHAVTTNIEMSEHAEKVLLGVVR